MWVWPLLTSSTQNVWRQPGTRVLHQSRRNWVSTLPCSAKLPADTAQPPWPKRGLPCLLHPLIGVCPQKHLRPTKPFAAVVSGCISACAWPTGIWTKYWPLQRTRWPFNWADFSPDERKKEMKRKPSECESSTDAVTDHRTWAGQVNFCSLCGELLQAVSAGATSPMGQSLLKWPQTQPCNCVPESSYTNEGREFNLQHKQTAPFNQKPRYLQDYKYIIKVYVCLPIYL